MVMTILTIAGYGLLLLMIALVAFIVYCAIGYNLADSDGKDSLLAGTVLRPLEHPSKTSDQVIQLRQRRDDYQARYQALRDEFEDVAV